MSAYDKNVGRLLFFIHKPSSALKDNPLALFLANDDFFTCFNDGLDSLYDFFRQVMLPPNSLCVPHKVMSGVAVEFGFMPKTSP